MTKEEIYFICGLLFGIIFQWSNTLCALIIGIVIGFHSQQSLRINPITNTNTNLHTNTTIVKRKKRNNMSTSSEIYNMLIDTVTPTSEITTQPPQQEPVQPVQPVSFVEQIYNTTSNLIYSISNKKEN